MTSPVSSLSLTPDSSLSLTSKPINLDGYLPKALGQIIVEYALFDEIAEFCNKSILKRFGKAKFIASNRKEIAKTTVKKIWAGYCQSIPEQIERVQLFSLVFFGAKDTLNSTVDKVLKLNVSTFIFSFHRLMEIPYLDISLIDYIHCSALTLELQKDFDPYTPEDEREERFKTILEKLAILGFGRTELDKQVCIAKIESRQPKKLQEEEKESYYDYCNS